MKAVMYVRTGLRVVEAPKPEPRDNQVLVAVRASTLTEPDMIRLPHRVPGAELAGIAADVGRNVRHIKAGDKVFAAASGMGGGWAEYAIADASTADVMPGNLSFEEAAAIPMAGITALGAIRKANVRPRKSVLVWGLPCGVWQYAVQLAKAAGAVVTASCPARSVGLARQMGADFVIGGKREEEAKAGGLYDAIIGVNGCCPLSFCKRLLNAGGVYVAAGGIRQGALGLLGGFAALGSGKTVTFSAFHAAAREPCLPYLKELAESEKLKPFIERVYPISDIAAAAAYRNANGDQGKIVLEVEF